MCSIEKDQNFDAEVSRMESEERFVSMQTIDLLYLKCHCCILSTIGIRLWANSHMCKYRLSRAEIVVLKKGILLQIEELCRFEPTLQGLHGDDESIFENASKSLRAKLAREAVEKSYHLSEIER